MRSVPETIQLDMNLRRVRTIYRALAIVFLPGAISGIFWVLNGISALWQNLAQGYLPPGALGPTLGIVAGVVFIGAAYVCIAQSMEATRRLEVLRDDPERKVRKMRVLFLPSLFGPYH